MYKLLLIAFVLYMNKVESANILAMVPMPYQSHIISYQPIFRALAARGHNITVISAFPFESQIGNLTHILVPNIILDVIKTLPANQLEMETITVKMFGLWNLGFKATQTALKLEQVQRFINDTNSKFDLIMIETYFQEAFLAFGHKFIAPVISLVPCTMMPIMAYFTGNHLPSSYVPNVLFDFTDHMSFHERSLNMIFYYWDRFYAENFHLEKQEKLMRENFQYPGSESIPPLKEMLKNTSLTLINYHLATGYQIPLHRNVVPFGGTNIKRAKELPKDLKTLMDSSENGVIYLSFGTFFNVKNLEPSTIETIMSVLTNIKQKVMLKCDDPKQLERFKNHNIEIRKWFPQPSILAHPNCKLFITHGGFNSMIEAIYHAVPLVVIPLLGDQRYNSKFIAKTGIGKPLDINTLTESKLLSTINHVLNEKSYKENIKIRSAIFKDNPMDMMDNVIYWIEYVIRHKGAPHLRPAVLDLYWYQRLMLDVIVFYLLLIFLIVYILVKIIRLFFKLITWMCCSKVSKNKKSKKE